MNEQQIREAILDVIDAGDPNREDGHGRFCNRWQIDDANEDIANAQRLDFCDAVIARLESNGIVYGMGPIDNTPAANMIPVDDVLSRSFRQTDHE